MIKKNIVAPYAIANLLYKTNGIPEAYIFADIGSSYTTLSIIVGNYLYNSSYFLVGGDKLTNDISSAFDIELIEAEKLKRRYGYDKRIFSFDPIVTSSKSDDGVEKKYKYSELNSVIKNYLDSYIYMFETCLKNLVSIYPKEQQNLPLVLGGGASRLGGLYDFFKSYFSDREVIQVPLTVIGVRHESFLNCVGGLIVANKFNNSTKVDIEANKNKNNNK